MRRSIAQLSLLYVAAVVLGVASAWLWLTRVGMSGVDAGIWRTNLLAGSREADAYTRARISLGAVLALDRSETLYYTTEHDDDGNTLRAECRYRIDGTPPPARWWSITAYAADNFLFANAERRYSVSGENAPLDNQGRFMTLVGPNAADTDRFWIPTAGTGGMRLTLRLYGAGEPLQRDPGALAAPSVKRLGDCP